ncbi:MAG TPA: ParA family protein [Thermoanaerobaculia bacterium]|nr:ParA family protein [Thermoanaerobaculia bacterium]
MILALVNVKGGVGKTTTAVNLAAAFGRGGLRTLVVDLDPQGSASYSLGVPRSEASPSTADLLLGKVEAAEAIRESSVAEVKLIPGALALAGLDLAVARKHEPEKLLKKALQPLRRRFDAIVVDCPPGLSILTVNGLAAADGYVVPLAPHHLDADALGGFFELLELHRDRIGKGELLGILLTMVDHRTKLTEELVAELRKRYGSKVFRTEIPINVRLAEAPGHGRSIFDYESWSTGAAAYGKLGAEILRRARKAELL